jgi:Domain of Unknown Function (DUF928)
MIKRIKPRQRFVAIHFIFAIFLLFGCISYSVPVLGKSEQPTKNTQDGTSRGRPTRRQGTGSRTGECAAVDMRLTALVAPKNVSLAIEEHLTFWFFIPYRADQVAFGEFSLQDEANTDIYRTSFKVSEKPGIVSVSIPSNMPPLEVNKNYRWYLKLYCNNVKNQVAREPSDFVFGWMQRVALKPKLASQLKALNTPQERINFYQKNGIWQSALTELGKLRVTQPKNTAFINEWANLLKAMGLEDLVKQPVLGEVTSIKN